MTVGSLILQLRRRSQDLRQLSNNQIITSALQNGIVWSANDMIDIVNQIMQEVSRLLVMYEASPIAKQLTENNLVIYDSVSFDYASGGAADLDNQVLGILGVLDKNTRIPEYLWIPPQRFYAYKNSEEADLNGKKFFTIVRDANTLEKTLRIIPAPVVNETIAVEIVILYMPSPFILTDIDSHIYFWGIDDFLVDVGELVMRLQIRDFDMIQVLQERIKIKLGLKPKSEEASK